MKTKTFILSLILCFIINSKKTANCQNDLSFVIKDTFLYHSLKKDVIKVNLQMIKKDTLHEYNLFGFDPLIRSYAIVDEDICNYKLNLISLLQDSSGKAIYEDSEYMISDSPYPILSIKKIKSKIRKCKIS
jgi:hypothetical protein